MPDELDAVGLLPRALCVGDEPRDSETALTPAALGQQCEARPNLTERAFGVPLGTLQFDLKPPVAFEPVLDGLELVIEVRMSEDQEAVLSYAAGCRGRS